MAVSIHVLSSDPALRNALVSRLERSPGLTIASNGSSPATPPTEIVVVPASECEPERCERLTSKGAYVIVLAAIPRDSERDRYLKAGAVAYVPMAVDSEELLAQISRLAPHVDRVTAGAGACNGHSPGRVRLGEMG